MAAPTARRFIPIVPALPNGLRDVLAASQVRSSLPADARQRGIFAIYIILLSSIRSLIFGLVDSLLNPCNCRSVWKCNCRQAQSSVSTDKSTPGSTGDLATLAHVAAMCCCAAPAPSPSTSPLMPLDSMAKIPPPRTISLTPSSASFPKHHTSRPPSPQQDFRKRSKHHHGHDHTHHDHNPSPVLELPPIRSSSGSPPPLTEQVPDFGFMPPISTITSLAGSGCTCGVKCACPGCVVHRGSEHAAKDLNDCADGQCGTCVDNQSGVALPNSTSPFSSISSATTSSAGSSSSLDYITKSASLNRFFARAAALPPPPPNRRLGNGIHLDPREVGYGTLGNSPPVKLPKLCCGGRCNCPNGQCVCGTACGGCCVDAESPAPLNEAFSAVSPQGVVATVTPTSPNGVPAAPLEGCCTSTPS